MYDQFYRFSGRPFQLTPDPGFFFESITHRKALSYLGYGLAQGEGFIVITGKVGAGKSILAEHLLASIDRQQLVAAKVTASHLEGGEIVRMVANAFALAQGEEERADKAVLLAAIEGFLQDVARSGRRVLLIVDEVQNLGIEALEELRLLSNFQLGAHPLLQIVLLGQPEFRTLLQSSPALEQLRQRVIASHHLEAMEPAEVGPYIEHRLARVGWKGNPAFDADVYAGLAKASGGVPRRVNKLVSRLLLLGAVEQTAHIDASMLEDVLADLDGDEAAVAGADGEEADVAPARADMAGLTEHFAQELAHRDEQIAELQQAVIELAAARMAAQTPAEPVLTPPAADLEPLLAELVALSQRIDTLEARTTDQNEAIRHVLIMLTEWIESENAAARAA